MNGSGEMTGTGRRANRLAGEKSPYLLQHAFNPVDWYPWGEEAFEKARRERKPVFLSIGYSTCHWCHVMEKECFEDPEVADLMNRGFVSIKVDREERPDLDQVYMTACRMMTGGGGWPLTIVMTPEKKPFFAATYIPKKSGFGRPGMMELVPNIERAWEERNREVLESAESVTRALRGSDRHKPGALPDRSVLDGAFQDFSSRFDSIHGGFGGAPKFPSPHNLSFLLRYWKRTGSPEALAIAEKTLVQMRLGGIFDQVGYGFHRYSTDREWLVPHFEKMLYDQAMLALAYLEAHEATGKAFHADTAREIFAYVLRDMRSPEGAFYSAEDADSEGVEGKFYLWTPVQIREVLPGDEADLIIRVFQVREEGNFREEASGRPSGVNILHLNRELQAGEKEIAGSALRKLLEAREKRIRPHRDDKILTDWNGLMIAALARGGRVLGENGFSDAAAEAAGFVMDRMRTPDGRLLHRYRDGDAGITANIDDYAFSILGLIELHEAGSGGRLLEHAGALCEDMLAHYWDRERGGFFFTPDDGEELIARGREIQDGALPSGNAVAMLDLLRLARLTGNDEWAGKAAGVARAFSGRIKDFPAGYTQFLCALDFMLENGAPSYYQ